MCTFRAERGTVGASGKMNYYTQNEHEHRKDGEIRKGKESSEEKTGSSH